MIAGLDQARREKDLDGIVEWADAIGKGYPGEVEAIFQEALPGIAQPTQWVSKRRRRQRQRQAKAAAEVPSVLDSRALKEYQELLPMSRHSQAERKEMIRAYAARTGQSELTITRKLRKIVKDGAAALNRKPRGDRGVSRTIPEQAEALFRQLCAHKSTRHLSTRILIDRVIGQFPDVKASDATFYRIAREPNVRVSRMTERKKRERFHSTTRWEAPHPNHTWVFDFTRADLWAWDGDPEKQPYRPWLVAILDERTRSCMYGCYVKGDPGMRHLQPVLLHAILPKNGDFANHWPQHGVPLNLRCDNGKVQASKWLEQVCQTLGIHLDHINVREPEQQGKIERFYGTVHRSYEAQLGPCYCGHDPKNKPDCFEDPSRGRRVWQKYPTLQSLNYGYHSWLVGKHYHRRAHSGIDNWTPFDLWLHERPGHVRSVDADWLRQELMQRAQREVRRGAIRLLGQDYIAPALAGYEAVKVEVRWDPADLGKVIVLGLNGPFEAIVTPRRNVANPKDWEEKRELDRDMRRARKVAEQHAADVATADSPTFEGEIERLRKARKDANVIDFPKPSHEDGADPSEADDDSLTAQILDAFNIGRGDRPDNEPVPAEEAEIAVKRVGAR